MPNIGTFPSNDEIFERIPANGAGSPGPFDKKTPSGFRSKTSS